MPREHSGSATQLRDAKLFAERGHRLHHRERSPNRALGVVLSGDWCAPYRHDRVTDELLDHATVAVDQGTAAIEVLRKEFAHILGVAALTKPRELNEIREDHTDESALPSLNGVRRRTY